MKNIIFIFAACGLLMASCSQPDQDSDKKGTVTFKVNAVNAIQTRGDIVTSGDDGPIPDFGTMNVYAFMNDGSGQYLYTQTIEMIGNYSSTTLSAVRILADNTFPPGDYKFLGVGAISNSGFQLPQPTIGTTNFNDLQATLTNPANSVDALFAGSVTQEVLATGASIVVNISRQVAGLFLYVTDVPTQIGGRDVAYLRLNITDANTVVNLTTGAGSVPTGSSYSPISILLTGQTVDTANNVYAGEGDINGLDVVPNSQIKSAYALPIGNVTMTLSLVDQYGVALKTWSVQDSDGGTVNLEPNVLLAIGIKNRADSELGDDGINDNDTADDDTGTVNEDDKPASLLTDETITVNVLRNWTDVQNLTLQESDTPPVNP